MFKKVVVVVTFLAVLIFVLNQKIRRIDCHTQYGPCPDKYLLDLNKHMGQWFFIPVNPNFQSARNIQATRISKKFPDTLAVIITLRQPIISLGPDLVADKDGIIMQIEHSQLPKLKIANLGTRDQLDAKEQLAARFLHELAMKNNITLQGDYENGILKTTIGHTEILIDVISSPANWQDSLQKLMARSKIEGKAPKIIDLRFSQPVLTY